MAGVARLREILAAHPDVQPEQLELEVLETSALENKSHVSRIIEDCRDLGISFALDDFGTGYSSLTYLKSLPAQVLKIDRSFVWGMHDDPDDLAILEGVIGLAEAFRLRVIAEGVESVEHGELLLSLGCYLAQGYVIGRPMSAEDLPGWLANWRPPPSWVGRLPVGRDHMPILFAIVERRAWILALTEYLEDTRTSAPELESSQCRFGRWLDGSAGQKAAASHARMVFLHERVHALAEELVQLKAAGELDNLDEKVAELFRLRDELMHDLYIEIGFAGERHLSLLGHAIG
jgi:hypothetical protein